MNPTLGLPVGFRSALRWLCLGFCWFGSASLQAKSPWTRVSAGNFVIYTNDTVSEARDWAIGLEAFRLHLQSIVPLDARRLDPFMMVEFEDPRTYKAVAGVREHEDPLHETTSIFNSRSGRFLGAISPEGDEEDARHAVFLQASVWLTRSSRFPLPVWLETGLRMIYADHVFTNGEMLIGRPQESSAKSLENGLRIPLARFLQMGTGSKDYDRPEGYYNAQAWAFVHFLLFGENGANRANLARYLDAILRSDDLGTCESLLYPQGLDDLNARFTRYVKTASYRMEAVPVKLGPIAAGLEVRPATEAEIQTAFGYLALAFHGVGEATPYFDRMAELAPRLPSTYEALAELANQRGDTPEMIHCYQEAVQAGSTFHLAHYYAYYPTVQVFYGSEAAADVTDAAAARRGVDGIKDLLRMRPGFFEGYDAMAGIMGSLTSTNDDDEAMLKEARRLFPDDAMLECGQAAYEILKHRFVDAQKRLDRVWGGTLANSGRTMIYAGKLKARLRAANSLYWLEKFAAAEDYASLEKLLPQLNGAPLRQDERERVRAVSLGFAGWTTLSLVREAEARQDWNAAEVLLGGVERNKLSPKLRAEADARAAEIKAAKAPAPKAAP